MTIPDSSSGVPALLVRLLTEPDLLDALDRRDFARLRQGLTAEPNHLAVIAAIDVPAVRFYLRRLQRKRLEVIEAIFPASLPAARKQYGADTLAADFWKWYQPPSTASVDEALAKIAAEWARFAGHLAHRGPLGWLGDLSRYEVMRWRAASADAQPVAPEGDGSDRRSKPVLAPGTGVGIFAVDVPLLLRTALDGSPIASPGTTRLMTWGHPDAGIQTMRLGAAAYQAVLACDGSRTIEQIAATVGAGREGGVTMLADGLSALVRAGALHMSAGE